MSPDNGTAVQVKEVPIPVLTENQRIIALLDLMLKRVYQVEGRTPNFQVREFDLAAVASPAVPSTVLNSDFNCDRWFVYFTKSATAQLRVFPGGSVPGTGGILVESAQGALIPNVNNQLAIDSTGAGAVHVIAVAIGGGAEFQIVGI